MLMYRNAWFSKEIVKTKEAHDKVSLSLNRAVRQIPSFFEERVKNQSAKYEELLAYNDELKLAYDEMVKKNLALEEEKILRERFVYALCHDLRNPLSVAMMAAQVLRQSLCDLEKKAKISSMIVNSLERICVMTSDLLNANQIQAGEAVRVSIQKFDAQIIFHKTIHGLISIHGNRFDVIIGNKPLIVDSDHHALRRIIENLASNAVKYGGLNSKIKISLDAYEGWFEVKVQNFGSFIQEKDFTKIFNQFVRLDSAQKSDKTGWGIGLTLVKGITQALGGEISVSSNEEEGTSFKVKLPIHSIYLNNSN